VKTTIKRLLPYSLRGLLEVPRQLAAVRQELHDLHLEVRRANQAAERGLDVAKMLLGRQLTNRLPYEAALLDEVEFKVFSQWGDDGIIQYLVRALDVRPETFIEFGVQSYRESNTRFLLEQDNWRGLIIEGDGAAVATIQADDIYWQHDLTAVPAFVRADNINAIFESHGFTGPIGILSIDIDGNDYWVWEAITVIDPVIVICEYRALFGPSRAVTIPYDPGFVRQVAHYSNLYYGASLAALARLAERKGYALVGSNSAGNNAYFVRRDRLGPLHPLDVRQAYRPARFREARDPSGNLTFLPPAEQLRLIAELPLYDLDTNTFIWVKDL
jgi:hypothetical protein